MRFPTEGEEIERSNWLKRRTLYSTTTVEEFKQKQAHVSVCVCACVSVSSKFV